MKRKRAAHLSTGKKLRRRPRGRRPNLQQIQDQVALLLLLIQHNFEKVLQHKRTR